MTHVPQKSYDLNYNEPFMNKLHNKKQLVHLSKHQTHGAYLQTEKNGICRMKNFL